MRKAFWAVAASVLCAACVASSQTPAWQPPQPDTYRVETAELGPSGASRSIHTAIVNASFFPTSKVQPLLGRLFLPNEFQSGSSRVVVLSRAFWERELEGKPSAIGTSLTVGGQAYTVVGVTPTGFDAPPGTDLWRPGAP